MRDEAEELLNRLKNIDPGIPIPSSRPAPRALGALLGGHEAALELAAHWQALLNNHVQLGDSLDTLQHHEMPRVRQILARIEAEDQDIAAESREEGMKIDIDPAMTVIDLLRRLEIEDSWVGKLSRLGALREELNTVASLAKRYIQEGEWSENLIKQYVNRGGDAAIKLFLPGEDNEEVDTDPVRSYIAAIIADAEEIYNRAYRLSSPSEGNENLPLGAGLSLPPYEAVESWVAGQSELVDPASPEIATRAFTVLSLADAKLEPLESESDKIWESVEDLQARAKQLPEDLNLPA